MKLHKLKYILTSFRTKKSYLCFLIAQLLLSFAIVVVALTSKMHFRTPMVLILEFMLFLTLAFDLLVVRWISEGKLFSKKTNVFDLILLCIFAATLLFLCFYQNDSPEDKDYRQLLQTDDIIIIVLVISRYIVQVARLILEIKQTTANRQIHKQIKNVDLNDIQLNHSTHLNQMIHADIKVRQKMTANAGKRSNLVEQLQ